ncbi:MAG TPA: HAD family phosphatase [Polyangiales bacterium]|nr:HAD family phosphatase [Polyangiales bacterium]
MVLLWDHDGVLVDTEGLYMQATQEVLATVGVRLDEAQYRELFLRQGTGAWHLAQGKSAHELSALKQRRNDRYTELLTRGDTYIPGALAMIAELAPHHRMAIVTSSRRAHFDAIHAGRALPGYFELILAREDYIESKPDPEPYLTAVARLGVAPPDCLVIEDSERGLRAAHAAGLRCWVIPSSLTRASDFTHAERRFDSIDALHRALRAST